MSYVVRLECFPEIHHSVIVWCVKNLGLNWRTISSTEDYHIVPGSAEEWQRIQEKPHINSKYDCIGFYEFDDENDAILFKLTFGCS